MYADINTGLEASDDVIAILEQFFGSITDEAAAVYDYVAARRNGKLVGVAATAPTDSYRKLAFLHVPDSHRRNGVATALVDAACRAADEPQMLAKTHIEWSAAHAFYRSHGWTRTPDHSSGLLTAYTRRTR